MKKTIILLLLITGMIQGNLSAQKPTTNQRDYYEIKLYRLASNEQVQQVNAFLKNAYLPALHRAGVKKVGVYHPIGNDTATEKRIFVFIPLPSLKHASTVEDLLVKDAQLQKDGDTYWNAAHNAVLYNRIETILLKTFPLMTTYQEPTLSGNKTDRVYELRSYEGGTERLYRQKVKMFNEGGEIALFKRLNFNAVFYAEVIAGSRMPNLMYMTSFNNMADRNEHWKAFGSSPEWTKLVVMPEYLNTVSRNETILMNPAEFSEL